MRPDSPGDLSLEEGCEVPEGPGRGGMWTVRTSMVKGVSEGDCGGVQDGWCPW